MARPRIVLHMIVGPTDEQYLTYALDNVADFVDLAVVNNNGGTSYNADRVRASRFAKEGRLIDFEAPFEGFSHARNLCFERTPDEPFDWLLKLDADEVVYPERFAEVVEFLKVCGTEVVRVPFWHLLSWRVYQEMTHVNQLYRWDPKMRWDGRVHETLRLGHSFSVAADRCAHVHYSYTFSQPEIYGKWTRYSILEGDPEHYTQKNTDPNTLLEDRYAMSGAPWFHEHPPGAREHVAAEMKRRRYHDVPLPMAVCVHGRRSDALLRTVTSVRDTQNPDYPFLFALFPEFGAEEDWGWLRTNLDLTGDLLPPLSRNFTREELHRSVARYAAQRPDVGHFLIVEAGTAFPAQGWQKAGVNAVYCLFDCYDAYRPKGARNTLLVPADVVGLHPDLLRVYESPYCLVEEPM